jgi:hypothetical protein
MRLAQSVAFHSVMSFSQNRCLPDLLRLLIMPDFLLFFQKIMAELRLTYKVGSPTAYVASETSFYNSRQNPMFVDILRA